MDIKMATILSTKDAILYVDLNKLNEAGKPCILRVRWEVKTSK